eukprot:Rhum_TRINITY_DN11197_c2_g1::Rhum_TRINITY_DN11197_c2_g1_i1::g.42537::m.42537
MGGDERRLGKGGNITVAHLFFILPSSPPTLRRKRPTRVRSQTEYHYHLLLCRHRPLVIIIIIIITIRHSSSPKRETSSALLQEILHVLLTPTILRTACRHRQPLLQVPLRLALLPKSNIRVRQRQQRRENRLLLHRPQQVALGFLVRSLKGCPEDALRQLLQGPRHVRHREVPATHHRQGHRVLRVDLQRLQRVLLDLLGVVQLLLLAEHVAEHRQQDGRELPPAGDERVRCLAPPRAGQPLLVCLLHRRVSVAVVVVVRPARRVQLRAVVVAGARVPPQHLCVLRAARHAEDAPQARPQRLVLPFTVHRNRLVRYACVPRRTRGRRVLRTRRRGRRRRRGRHRRGGGGGCGCGRCVPPVRGGSVRRQQLQAQQHVAARRQRHPRRAVAEQPWLEVPLCDLAHGRRRLVHLHLQRHGVGAAGRCRRPQRVHGVPHLVLGRVALELVASGGEQHLHEPRHRRSRVCERALCAVDVHLYAKGRLGRGRGRGRGRRLHTTAAASARRQQLLHRRGDAVAAAQGLALVVDVSPLVVVLAGVGGDGGQHLGPVERVLGVLLDGGEGAVLEPAQLRVADVEHLVGTVLRAQLRHAVQEREHDVQVARQEEEPVLPVRQREAEDEGQHGEDDGGPEDDGCNLLLAPDEHVADLVGDTHEVRAPHSGGLERAQAVRRVHDGRWVVD